MDEYEPGAGSMGGVGAGNGNTEDSWPESFVSKLEKLNETQQSINTLSCWLRYHHKRSKQAADIWAAEALAVPPDRHLLFVYLLNDVLQTARRKSNELCDDFIMRAMDVVPQMYKSMPPQYKEKVKRIIKIWEERGVLAMPDLATLRSRLDAGVASAPSNGSTLAPQVARADSAPKGPGDLGKCLESIARSDVLDYVAREEEKAVEPMLLMDDISVNEPAEIGALRQRAEHATRELDKHKALLQGELNDRKRLVAVLCAAIEAQDGVCSDIEAAIEQSEWKRSRIEGACQRLDEIQGQFDAIADMAED
mmetsp:Transcript_2468/g.7245  ORF Transcript_2468/g.7245 Transcript_2468/m.7245 type:complete len:308 (-) Transcript_2468:80-1003(-)